MSEEISNAVIVARLDDFKQSNKEEHVFIEKGISSMNETLKIHNGRLRKNEEWRFKATGALWLFGFLLTGLLFPLTVYFINSYFTKTTHISQIKTDANGNQYIEYED